MEQLAENYIANKRTKVELRFEARTWSKTVKYLLSLTTTLSASHRYKSAHSFPLPVTKRSSTTLHLLIRWSCSCNPIQEQHCNIYKPNLPAQAIDFLGNWFLSNISWKFIFPISNYLKYFRVIYRNKNFKEKALMWIFCYFRNK